jgi:cysteinyl-tRNA synthetase
MSSSLQVYNSYTRKKELFSSITPGHVGMYVCGPTVSGESHLGHARPYITFDVVYRYLTHLGYKVRYVRNITDAGHFEEEGREAEDKISTKAKLEKLEPMELVQKYTNLFHLAFEQFNTIAPSIEPTATGHIVEQIEMIKEIMAAGYAYESNGSVYFDVKKYAANYPYGTLSGRVIDELLETTRELEGQSEKQNVQDFALWKNAAPEHIMRWQSPWGVGFPGWHIECSAMSKKYLGNQFDIHGGGMDLQFPHHESEIAQSSICNGGLVCAKYWLHNNMITIDGRKMGKSYNNVIKLTELFSGTHHLLAKAYSPMTIRFFILQTQYRSTLDFGNEALLAAEKGLKRLMEAYKIAMHWQPTNSTAADAQLDAKVLQLVAQFDTYMNDDLNTAKVLASMFELASIIYGIKDQHIPLNALSATTISTLQQQLKLYIIDILGLKEDNATDTSKLNGVMQVLINLRASAKAKKDYATSDAIRQQLEAIGIAIKDEKDGTATYNLV